MTTFALVHGGAHGGWCWELLVPELERRGHRSVAPDLPIEDELAGAEMWARVVTEAIDEATRGNDGDVIVVGHSLGGLVVPLVAIERPVRRMVFLGAMVPMPGMSYLDYLATQPDAIAFSGGETLTSGEVPDESDAEISWEQARSNFYHDVPEDLARRAWERFRPQAMTVFIEPCPLDRWPEVPSTYILMREDRSVGQEWSRRVALERLDADLVEMEGSHSPFLPRPAELADILTSL